jgi:hypothetical protein
MYDDFYILRVITSRSLHTPQEVLTFLSDHKDHIVRLRVANNPNTPKHIKDYLTAQFFMRNYGK